MAFKFRRRQKIFLGFYLNFSSKGISTTIGVKGLRASINKSGAYLNTGILGTGISARSKIANWNDKIVSDNPSSNMLEMTQYPVEEPYLFLPDKLRGEIKSKDANDVTSKGLAYLKETLLVAYEEKKDIEKEIINAKKQLKNAKAIRLL